MNHGERQTLTPGGIPLASLDIIPDGAARNFVVQLPAGRFHGFVIRRGSEVTGYVDRCPHMGLPLARVLDDYLAPSGDLVMCAWHGALFEVDGGRCIGGPCFGSRLKPWPVTVIDGMIVTAAAVSA